jgi:hypothetical protein
VVTLLVVDADARAYAALERALGARGHTLLGVMPTTFPVPLRDMSAMAGLCVVRADGRVACADDNGFQNPPPLVDVPGFD